jgi:hypothetical protein
MFGASYTFSEKDGLGQGSKEKKDADSTFELSAIRTQC